MSISRTIVAVAWLATGCTTPMVRTSSEPANASELRECSIFSSKQNCASTVLEYLPSPMHDDDLGFGVGANLLLETGTAQSRDRTGDVLSKLAELAAQIAKLATGRPGPHLFGSLKSAETPTAVRRKACAKALSAFTLTEFVDLSTSIPAGPGEIKTELSAEMERAMFLPGFSASRVGAGTVALSSTKQPGSSLKNAFPAKQQLRKG